MTTAAGPGWTDTHWATAFDKLLADWARLKGVSLEVARIYWPTDGPPIHTRPPTTEAP